jgi:hypothetical protein
LPKETSLILRGAQSTLQVSICFATGTLSGIAKAERVLLIDIVGCSKSWRQRGFQIAVCLFFMHAA